MQWGCHSFESYLVFFAILFLNNWFSQTGRHRWVIYTTEMNGKNTFWDVDGSMVPPEWYCLLLPLAVFVSLPKYLLTVCSEGPQIGWLNARVLPPLHGLPLPASGSDWNSWDELQHLGIIPTPVEDSIAGSQLSQGGLFFFWLSIAGARGWNKLQLPGQTDVIEPYLGNHSVLSLVCFWEIMKSCQSSRKDIDSISWLRWMISILYVGMYMLWTVELDQNLSLWDLGLFSCLLIYLFVTISVIELKVSSCKAGALLIALLLSSNI